MGYYFGEVTNFSSTASPETHTITYDNKQWATLDLSNEQYELLPPGSKKPKKTPKKTKPKTPKKTKPKKTKPQEDPKEVFLESDEDWDASEDEEMVLESDSE